MRRIEPLEASDSFIDINPLHFCRPSTNQSFKATRILKLEIMAIHEKKTKKEKKKVRRFELRNENE